jgi:fluoroacetyl-CoA thioesterase
MAAEIRPGLVGEATRTVGSADLASAVGSGQLDVFATPVMLGLIELAAASAVDHLLPDGSTTVGTHLDVRHLAPSPLGIEVRARAELVAVDSRKLTFSVEAFDAVERIGTGTHERAIVSAERLLGRANGKRADIDPGR